MARKRRSTRKAVLLIAAAAALVLLLRPWSNGLWHAITQVESGGNASARNPATDAVGIAQITKKMVDDCNRILGTRRFSYDDRWSAAASRRMFDVYLDYWGRQYERQTGRRCTDEVRARIWNGGPRGWERSGTLEYWERVRKHL